MNDAQATQGQATHKQATHEQATHEQVGAEKLQAAMKQMMEGGTTIREMKGITGAEMEAVYSVGFNFYKTGRMDEAEKIFKFLVMFDHMNPKYWIGMGAVQQVRRQYDAAVASYGYASFLDLGNPKPQYFAAECFAAKGDRENALSALAALEAYAPKNTEDGREYRRKASELKAALEHGK